MSLVFQRILAAVTAMAVLVMSVDCACAGPMSWMTRECGANAGDVGAAMPCCSHHKGAAHHCKQQRGETPRHDPKPCNGACEHCGQTVINDTVAPASVGVSHLPHGFVPVVATPPAALCAADFLRQRSVPILADLPPLPTLLSLHCALIN